MEGRTSEVYYNILFGASFGLAPSAVMLIAMVCLVCYVKTKCQYQEHSRSTEELQPASVRTYANLDCLVTEEERGVSNLLWRFDISRELRRLVAGGAGSLLPWGESGPGEAGPAGGDHEGIEGRGVTQGDQVS